MPKYQYSSMEILTPERADVYRVPYDSGTEIEVIYEIEDIEVQFDGYEFWECTPLSVYEVLPDGREIEIQEPDTLECFDDICNWLNENIDPSDYYPFGE